MREVPPLCSLKPWSSGNDHVTNGRSIAMNHLLERKIAGIPGHFLAKLGSNLSIGISHKHACFICKQLSEWRNHVWSRQVMIFMSVGLWKFTFAFEVARWCKYLCIWKYISTVRVGLQRFETHLTSDTEATHGPLGPWTPYCSGPGFDDDHLWPAYISAVPQVGNKTFQPVSCTFPSAPSCLTETTFVNLDNSWVQESKLQISTDCLKSLSWIVKDAKQKIYKKNPTGHEYDCICFTIMDCTW